MNILLVFGAMLMGYGLTLLITGILDSIVENIIGGSIITIITIVCFLLLHTAASDRGREVK